MLSELVTIANACPSILSEVVSKVHGVCAEKPSAPGSLTVSELTTNSVTLTWEAPETDGGAPIESYLIEKREGMGEFSFAKTVDGSTRTAELKGLRKGKEYQFRVSAENSRGQSEPMVMENSITPTVIGEYDILFNQLTMLETICYNAFD